MVFWKWAFFRYFSNWVFLIVISGLRKNDQFEEGFFYVFQEIEFFWISLKIGIKFLLNSKLPPGFPKVPILLNFVAFSNSIVGIFGKLIRQICRIIPFREEFLLLRKKFEKKSFFWRVLRPRGGERNSQNYFFCGNLSNLIKFHVFHHNFHRLIFFPWN